MAQWLESPPSKAYVAWLKGQIEFYRRKLSDLILAEDLNKARTATGALKTYEEILEAFEPPTAAERETEEPFTDPAERLSLRKAAR